MATTADARTWARRIVEETLAAAGVAPSPTAGGDPKPGPERATEPVLDLPGQREAVVAEGSRDAWSPVDGSDDVGPSEGPTARQIAQRIAQAALLAFEERRAALPRSSPTDVDPGAPVRNEPACGSGTVQGDDAPVASAAAKEPDPAAGTLDPEPRAEPATPAAPAASVATKGQDPGGRAQAVELARRIVAEVMAEEEARAHPAAAGGARAAEAIAAPEPVPAPDPLPRPDPFPEPSPAPDPAPDPSPPDPSPDPYPPDPSPDPYPPDPGPDPLPPDPFPPEPEPEPVGEADRGSAVPAAVPVASVDLFPTVTHPTDVAHDEPTIVSGDEPTLVADGPPGLAPDETRELPAEPAKPSGPPPLPVAVVSGWWRKRRAVRQRQRAMAQWAPDATERPRRTGRWFVATIVMLVAIALLFPMAVDALRQLVAL